MTRDDDAKAILARAYALKDARESRALYRDWARKYDATMVDGLGYITPRETAALLAGHVQDPGASILDVGCGTGLAGKALFDLGFSKIDGLDFSPEMLGVAGSRGCYRTLHEADLNQPLTLPDNCHDALICTGTFTHAHVGADCLGELFRILKPGGVFACTVHKDIWETQGFAAITSSLTDQAVMETLHFQPGAYYSGSREPEGYYIAWRKQA